MLPPVDSHHATVVLVFRICPIHEQVLDDIGLVMVGGVEKAGPTGLPCSRIEKRRFVVIAAKLATRRFIRWVPPTGSDIFERNSLEQRDGKIQCLALHVVPTPAGGCSKQRLMASIATNTLTISSLDDEVV